MCASVCACLCRGGTLLRCSSCTRRANNSSTRHDHAFYHQDGTGSGTDGGNVYSRCSEHAVSGFRYVVHVLISCEGFLSACNPHAVFGLGVLDASGATCVYLVAGVICWLSTCFRPRADAPKTLKALFCLRLRECKTSLFWWWCASDTDSEDNLVESEYLALSGLGMLGTILLFPIVNMTTAFFTTDTEKIIGTQVWTTLLAGCWSALVAKVAMLAERHCINRLQKQQPSIQARAQRQKETRRLWQTILMSLVASSAFNGHVQPWAAFVISTFSALSYRYLETHGYAASDRARGAIVLAGGAIVGIVFTALFRDSQSVALFTSQQTHHSKGKQFGVALVSIVAVFIWTFVTIFPTLLLAERWGLLFRTNGAVDGDASSPATTPPPSPKKHAAAEPKPMPSPSCTRAQVQVVNTSLAPINKFPPKSPSASKGVVAR
eukprot:m.420264 g.420264  ORF g.420264 m.420264 type:complete len:435 (+) comp20187_c0_seq18:163-1467(+)